MGRGAPTGPRARAGADKRADNDLPPLYAGGKEGGLPQPGGATVGPCIVDELVSTLCAKPREVLRAVKRTVLEATEEKLAARGRTADADIFAAISADPESRRSAAAYIADRRRSQASQWRPYPKTAVGRFGRSMSRPPTESGGRRRIGQWTACDGKTLRPGRSLSNPLHGRVTPPLPVHRQPVQIRTG